MAAAQDDYEKQVMFIVGRMNPPTPGHIRGLCIPFLLKVREMAITKLGLSDDNDTSLEILLHDAAIVPRIYITLTTNAGRISKLKTKVGLYQNGAVKGLVDDNDNADKPNGIFYVKDTNLENPLDPSDKKWYVTTMLFNELKTDYDWLYDMRDDDLSAYLDEIVVCQTDGDASECSASLFSAMKCALKLSNSDDNNNLTIFMGEEEVEERADICRRIHCVPITRTEGSSSGDKKMSGSLIRLYAAGENYDDLYSEYEGLLDGQDIDHLIYLIRKGLMMFEPGYDDAGLHKKRKRMRKRTRKRRSKRSTSRKKKPKHRLINKRKSRRSRRVQSYTY